MHNFGRLSKGGALWESDNVQALRIIDGDFSHPLSRSQNVLRKIFNAEGKIWA